MGSLSPPEGPEPVIEKLWELLREIAVTQVTTEVVILVVCALGHDTCPIWRLPVLRLRKHAGIFETVLLLLSRTIVGLLKLWSLTSL